MGDITAALRETEGLSALCATSCHIDVLTKSGINVKKVGQHIGRGKSLHTT